MPSLAIDRIRTTGPLPFDMFMEMCLYDPDFGYFTAGEVRSGVRGDFVTSPEVSPHFGRMVGSWVADHLPKLATDWAVVEIGAGSGSLLASMCDELPTSVPVYAVERSVKARHVLALQDRVRLVSDVAEVTEPHAVIVMNEVIDNVPATLVRRGSDRWNEVWVSEVDGTLTVDERDARTIVAEWSDRHLDAVPVGVMAVAQIEATGLVASLCERFDGLAMCIVDYGGPTNELTHRDETTLVRTYRHQRTGLDFLVAPGETDITVDMNVDVVADTLDACGASVTTLRQSEFLDRQGATESLAGLRVKEQALAATGDVVAQLVARSEAVGLRALVDEQGFGTFWVVTAVREPTGRLAASQR